MEVDEMALDVGSLKQKLNKENGLKFIGMVQSGCRKVADRIVRLWKSGRNGKIVCVGGAVLALVFIKCCIFSGGNGSASGCPDYLIDSITEWRDKQNRDSPDFQLGEFVVEAFEVNPAVDDIGCYGEVQSVKAVVRFEPIEDDYYWHGGFLERLQAADFYRVDKTTSQDVLSRMPECEKISGLIRKLNDIRPDSKVRMSDEDVELVHHAVYDGMMCKNGKGEWRLIERGGFSPLKYHDEIGSVCTAKAAKGKYMILCDEKGRPDSKGQRFIDAYSQYMKRLSSLSDVVNDLVLWHEDFRKVDGKQMDEWSGSQYPSVEGDDAYARLNGDYQRLSDAQKRVAEELESHRAECERLEKQLYSINGEYERRQIAEHEKSLNNANRESKESSSKQQRKFAAMAASVQTGGLERAKKELERKLADAKTVNRAKIEAYTAQKEANDKIVNPIREKLRRLTEERTAAWNAFVAYERKTAKKKLNELSSTYAELAKLAEKGLPYPYGK